jgi:hypothetical protein
MKKAVFILSAIVLMYIQPNKVMGQTKLENLPTQQPRFTEVLTEEEETQGEWLNKISKIDSLENFYFELVSTKTKDDYPDYICVQIFEKPSRQFVQEIDLSEGDASGCFCDFGGGDFNFDGWEDFSLFTCMHTLDNTTSRYFLYDPEKKEFFESGFEGSSLTFDYSDQTINEYNRCCAGRYIYSATYKVVNNEMVVVESHCFELDDDGDVFETDCEIGSYMEIRLKSVGKKEKFQLKITLYDQNMEAGGVLYKGQAERIPIRFDHEEDNNNFLQLFYNEIYKGEITGVYILNMIYGGDVIHSVSYIRKKDNKKFRLEVIEQK